MYGNALIVGGLSGSPFGRVWFSSLSLRRLSVPASDFKGGLDLMRSSSCYVSTSLWFVHGCSSLIIAESRRYFQEAQPSFFFSFSFCFDAAEICHLIWDCCWSFFLQYYWIEPAFNTHRKVHRSNPGESLPC